MSLISGWRRVRRRTRVGRIAEGLTRGHARRADEIARGKKYRANTFAIMLKPPRRLPRVAPYLLPLEVALTEWDDPYVLVLRLIRASSFRVLETFRLNPTESIPSPMWNTMDFLFPSTIYTAHLRSMYQHRSHLKRSTELACLVLNIIAIGFFGESQQTHAWDGRYACIRSVNIFWKVLNIFSIKSFIMYTCHIFICTALVISEKLM